MIHCTIHPGRRGRGYLHRVAGSFQVYQEVTGAVGKQNDATDALVKVGCSRNHNLPDFLQTQVFE